MTEFSGTAIPCGVADVERDRGYFATADGSILCVDLSNGAVLGRSAVPGDLLAVYQGTVIGWRPAPDQLSSVLIFALKLEGSALKVSWEARLDLPSWIDASAPRKRFHLMGEASEEGFIVAWEAHARYQGGAPPPREVEDAATRDGGGLVVLDPETGAVKSEGAAVPKPKQEFLPELPPDRRILPYSSGSAWFTQPWRTSSGESLLVRSADKPGIILGRRESSSGSSLREVRLTQSDSEAVVTPDGQWILAHQAGVDGPACQVFNAESGERVADLPFEPGTEDAAVVNGRVLYLVGENSGSERRRSIRCRSLSTGEELWAQTLGQQPVSAPPPLRR